MFKKFIMLVASFLMVVIVNAQDEVKDVTDNIEKATNDVQNETAGEKAGEIAEITAEEKAKEKQVNDVDTKLEKTAEEIQDTVNKKMAEDEALGEEEAKAVAIEEAIAEPAVAEKKESSWFGWLWPFGGDDDEDVVVAEIDEEEPAKEAPAEEPVAAKEAPVEEPAKEEPAKEPVAAKEAPVEEPAKEEPAKEPVAAKEAPVEEPAVAEEAPVTEPVVEETDETAPAAEEGSSWFAWLWPFGEGEDEEAVEAEETLEEPVAEKAPVAEEEEPAVVEEAPVAEEEPAVVEEAPVTEPVVEEITEETDETAPAAEEGSSWFAWLWPFGEGEDEEAVEAEEPAVAEEAPVVEEEPAVAEEAPVVEEEPVVAEEATNEEPEVAEEAVAEETGEKTDYVHKMLYYFPNVFLDLSDIFTLGLGVGAESGLRIGATRYCQLGGNYGDVFFLQKGFKRQVGGGYGDGYNGQLGPLAIEKRYVDDTFGSLSEYIIKQENAYMVRPTDPLYVDNVRDFWAIGAEGGWLVKINFELHPIEFVDFFTGLFGIDICEDDL